MNLIELLTPDKNHTDANTIFINPEHIVSIAIYKEFNKMYWIYIYTIDNKCHKITRSKKCEMFESYDECMVFLKYKKILDNN